MKRFQLFLTGLFLMTCHLSMAQLQQGNLLIGGTAGFNIQFTDGDDNPFTLSLNPGIASFISDQVAVGGSLGLTYLKSGDFSSTAFSLLPLVRYYIPGASESMAFFLEGRAGLALVSFDFGGDNTSESAFQFGFGPGMAFFLSDDVSIDLLLAFNRIGGDFDQSDFGLIVGFQVYLSKDKE